jgi:hypothetical protein
MMSNNICTKEIEYISNNSYYLTTKKILKIICLVGSIDNLVTEDMGIVCL